MQYLTKLRAFTKVKAGMRFDRLLTLGAVREYDGTGSPYLAWHCRCDCGNEAIVRSDNLLRGATRSCGCYRLETVKRVSTKHGHARDYTPTPEHRAWSSMISRCENPFHKSYPSYGGRGISVCERWKRFENFIQDLGPRPSKDYSVERIDNNGNYEPSNVKWATRLEQMSNLRTNRWITAQGHTLHLQEWSRRTGIPKGTLWRRLHKGWSEERAICTPLRPKKKNKTV